MKECWINIYDDYATGVCCTTKLIAEELAYKIYVKYKNFVIYRIYVRIK